MKIFIQIFLIAAVVISMFIIWRQDDSQRQAISKLFISAFTVFAVIVIIIPSWSSKVASLVGIHRGADLLLYCLVIVVLSMLANNSLRRHRRQVKEAKLVRQIVLLQVKVDELEESIKQTSCQAEEQTDKQKIKSVDSK